MSTRPTHVAINETVILKALISNTRPNSAVMQYSLTQLEVVAVSVIHRSITVFKHNFTSIQRLNTFVQLAVFIHCECISLVAFCRGIFT